MELIGSSGEILSKGEGIDKLADWIIKSVKEWNK